MDVRIVLNLRPGTHRDQHRGTAAGNHVHRLQGARVRPVGVLDDEEQRTLLGEVPDPVRRIARRCGNLPHHIPEWVQWAQRRPTAAQNRQDGEPTRPELVAELEKKPGLADPGLTRHQRESSRAGFDGRPMLVQPRPCFRPRHEPAERTGFESVTRPAAPEHRERGNRVGDALESEGAERFQHEKPGDQSGRVAADDDLARIARRLEPRRHVRNLTPHVGQAVLAARRHSRDKHFAGVHPGPRPEFADAQSGWELGTQDLDGRHDVQGRRQRFPTRRLRRLGIAKVGNRPITLELRDHASVRGDDLGDPVLVRVEHLVPVLGIERRRELGRPDEVGEHHGQLPSLRSLRRGRHGTHDAARRAAPPGRQSLRRTCAIYVCPGRSNRP